MILVDPANIIEPGLPVSRRSRKREPSPDRDGTVEPGLPAETQNMEPGLPTKTISRRRQNRNPYGPSEYYITWSPDGIQLYGIGPLLFEVSRVS